MWFSRANRFVSRTFRLADDVFVVRSQPVIYATRHQHLRQFDVVGINVFFLRKRNFRRLLVSTLAKPHPRPCGIRLLHVLKRPVQIALENDPDVPAVTGEESIIKNVQRFFGVVAPLHVDSDEGLELASAVQDVLHVGDTQLLVEVETHRRELH